MSSLEKSLERLLGKPKDYRFEELDALLTKLGYKISNAGKTSGSRVRYVKKNNKSVVIFLHKPHNPSILKRYALELVIKTLKEQGDISE